MPGGVGGGFREESPYPIVTSMRNDATAFLSNEGIIAAPLRTSVYVTIVSIETFQTAYLFAASWSRAIRAVQISCPRCPRISTRLASQSSSSREIL